MGGDAQLRAMRLAAQQHGVVRRSQALQCGLTERQVRYRVMCGHWEELFPWVYRVEGSAPTWHQRLKAVSLWAAYGFALSHRTAAVLHGFDRYRGEPVELSVTRDLRSSAAQVHRVGCLATVDLCLVNGLRVTSVTRTLLDLASNGPEHSVRAACDQALARKWTSLDKLDAALEQSAWHRGTCFLRRLLRQYQGGDGPSESELEARVLELFEAAGLPRPLRQRRVMVGNRVRRLDFTVPGTPIVVEADGYAHHSSPTAFEEDRVRNNALTARGYRVLHWTWAAVHARPDELVTELCRAMGR